MGYKYILIEENAYMGYCHNRYFGDYFLAKNEFNELKRLNINCKLLTYELVDWYKKDK